MIVSLIKNNFSVFSLNPIALASSWTLLYQLAPQSCTFIISFNIQTPQFLSHLVFQNIILLVPLDLSQLLPFTSSMWMCMTLSCILLPLTDTPFSLCIPLSWTQALVSPLSWWLSNLYFQPSLRPIWASPLESTWMLHEPLQIHMSRTEFFPVTNLFLFLYFLSQWVNIILKLLTEVQQSFSLFPSPMSPVLHPVGHQVEWILFSLYLHDLTHCPCLGWNPWCFLPGILLWRSHWLLDFYSCPTLNPLATDCQDVLCKMFD